MPLFERGNKASSRQHRIVEPIVEFCKRNRIPRQPRPTEVLGMPGGKVRLPGLWFARWVGAKAYALARVLDHHRVAGNEVRLTAKQINAHLGPGSRYKTTLTAIATLERLGLVSWRVASLQERRYKPGFRLSYDFGVGEYSDLVCTEALANQLVNGVGQHSTTKPTKPITLRVIGRDLAQQHLEMDEIEKNKLEQNQGVPDDTKTGRSDTQTELRSKKNV